MTLPLYDYGDAVRVIRNVRNDGTYPGLDTGAPLVRRGSIGQVINVGTFLQDQIIYSVHFLEAGKVVGCREEELIPSDAPWTPSRFEFRDKVESRVRLAINGEVIVEPGTPGEILKVLREENEPVQYHVIFPKKVLQVPEDALAPLHESRSNLVPPLPLGEGWGEGNRHED
jgi:nitrogen fixation protein NifZ